MILKKFDYLSPLITFYHKDSLSHSSIVSGILSIISFILIILIASYFSLDLIKRQNPTSFYYNRFIEDAGIFPLNASYFFHFLSLSHFVNKLKDDGVDFRSFRVLGIETYFPFYLHNKNISSYDHWIYGFCNNDTDTEGISHLIDYDFFKKSACIRKYFNSSEQKYYDTGNPKFRWPEMSHGTYNSENKFYTIILEKCQDETLGLILGEGNHCKSDKEISKLIGYNSVAHLYYIDNYVDVLNYKNANTKFFYNIENSFQIGSYTTNHLIFNPTTIKTHNGLILDHTDEILSYSYERNDVFTYNDDNNTYTVYYLWLKNRLNYYERSYKRIQDLISNIGGIYQSIIFFSVFINRFYNNFIVLYDIEKLLKSSVFYEKHNHFKKKIKLDNSKEIKNIEDNIFDKENNNKVNTNVKNKVKYKFEKDISKGNIVCITDFKDSGCRLKKSDHNYNKINSITIPNSSGNTKKKNFLDFILFKLTLKQRNKTFETYHNFRTKLLSEEHLVKNHLNIYFLLKANEKKLKSKRRYSYQIKDLMNLI